MYFKHDHPLQRHLRIPDAGSATAWANNLIFNGFGAMLSADSFIHMDAGIQCLKIIFTV